jgi:hypothetical protein
MSLDNDQTHRGRYLSVDLPKVCRYETKHLFEILHLLLLLSVDLSLLFVNLKPRFNKALLQTSFNYEDYRICLRKLS